MVRLIYLISTLFLLSLSASSLAAGSIDLSKDIQEMSPMQMDHCDTEAEAMDAECIDHCSALFASTSLNTYQLVRIEQHKYPSYIQGLPTFLPAPYWRPPSSHS